MNEPAPAPLIVYIIAGEASGDFLGAHLMRSLRVQSQRPILFYGIGGERMTAEGLKSLFPYYELSMLGFVEILPYLFNIFARINNTVEDVITKHPDIVITIDCPGFCVRVVERLRKEKLKTKFVHYVAPTVWAYKPHRAYIWAGLFDHLLCLLPFEPPYFREAKLACSWVGHPIVAETQVSGKNTFREKYNIAPHTKLFCLLPGSRKSEVEKHMPIFARAVAMLATQFPDFAIAVAVPKNVLAFVAPFFKDCPFRAVVTSDEQDKKDAIAAADLAIVKSGTVALEVAMAGTPMLVTYRVHPISAWMFRRVSLTRYVNLVNIIAKREIIPELLQEYCTPLMIASAGASLIADTERKKRQTDEAAKALAQLRPADMLPSDKAAHKILDIINTNKR